MLVEEWSRRDVVWETPVNKWRGSNRDKAYEEEDSVKLAWAAVTGSGKLTFAMAGVSRI
jgi:cation transport regulator ChaB